jgi:hypothetical protein
MNFKTKVIAVLLIGSALIGAWAFWPRTIRIPKIAFPEVKNSPIIELPAGNSIVSIPVSVDVTWLVAQMNERLPKSWTGEDSPSIPVIKNERLTWDVKRSDLTLVSCDENGLTCSCTLSGRARISGKIDIKIATKSVSGHADVNATVVVRLRPTVANDWSMTPNLSIVSYNVTKAKIPVKHVGNISVRGEAKMLLEKEKAKLIGKANEKIALGLKVKENAGKAWRDLHRADRIQSDGDGQDKTNVWLTNSPKTVTMQPLVYGKNRIQTGLAIESKLLATVSTSSVIAPVPSNLPKLTLAPKLADQFEIQLPIVTEFKALNNAIADEIHNDQIIFDDKDGFDLSVQSCEVVGWGDSLLVSADVTGSYEGIDVEGRVLLTGTPKFDAKTQTLSIDNFQYTLETQNTLASIADWLLNPIVTEKISEKLIYNASSEFEELSEKLQRRVNELASTLPPEFKPSVSIEPVNIQDVLIGNDRIMFVVGAKGSISLEVNGL